MTRRHTCKVRQTVREVLRGVTGSQAVIALLAITVVFVVAGVILNASRDDDPPATPSAAVPVAELPAVEPEVDEGVAGDGSGSSVTAMVAGFGLIGLWVVGGGVALTRARHRRVGESERMAR